MNKESFIHLEELEKIRSEILASQKAVSDEEKRILDLESKKLDAVKNLNELTLQNDNLSQRISETTAKLTQIEERVERSKVNQKSITTQTQLAASQKEFDALSKDKNSLEENLLLLLENQDSIKNDVDDIRAFLHGLETTLKEITLEVEIHVKNEKEKLKGHQEKLHTLIKTCPSEVQDLYKALSLKFNNTPFLAKISENTCSFCHFSIEKNILTLINKGTGVEFCPSCRRLLCP